MKYIHILMRRVALDISAFKILNRFCLKMREEAVISNRAVERIRSVSVSLLKTSQRSE